MVKCGVLFEVRIEFNIIRMSYGFRGLNVRMEGRTERSVWSRLHVVPPARTQSCLVSHVSVL
jgi:hypothetical protein